MALVQVEPRAATLIKKLKALQGEIEDPAPILERSQARLAGLVKSKPVLHQDLADRTPCGSGRNDHGALGENRDTRPIRKASRLASKLRYRGTSCMSERMFRTGASTSTEGKATATYRQKAKALRFSVKSIATAGGRSRKIRSILKRTLLSRVVW